MTDTNIEITENDNNESEANVSAVDRAVEDAREESSDAEQAADEAESSEHVAAEAATSANNAATDATESASDAEENAERSESAADLSVTALQTLNEKLDEIAGLVRDRLNPPSTEDTGEDTTPRTPDTTPAETHPWFKKRWGK